MYAYQPTHLGKLRVDASNTARVFFFRFKSILQYIIFDDLLRVRQFNKKKKIPNNMFTYGGGVLY